MSWPSWHQAKPDDLTYSRCCKPYSQIPPIDIYTSMEAWKSFQPALSQQSFKFKIVLKRYISNTEDTYSDTIPPRDLQKDAKRYFKCTSILKQSFSDGNSFLKMYSKLSNSLLKTGVNSTIFNECFCIVIFCPLSRILY